MAITKLHGDKDRMIPTWTGSSRCDPTADGSYVWEDGMVMVNTWRRPAYRALLINDRNIDLFHGYMAWMFPREGERQRIMDWLTWCLQNEGDKPMWAPLLYSSTKGSGKSTFCVLASELFGPHNTAIQNSVDKLTGRFNVTPLMHKLIVCEEVALRPDSVQGNTLKTFITERETLAERKGQESASVRQCCCFLLTTNHFPAWIESADRRYWIAEIDHDGHTSGERAREFSDLVGQLSDNLRDPAFVMSIYKWLIRRTLTDGFTALTLNLATDSTDVMRRVHSGSQQVTLTALSEHLQASGCAAFPETALRDFVMRELKISANALRYMMPELGWHAVSVKWGGKDYVRRVWFQEGHSVYRGQLKCPDGSETRLSDLSTFAEFELTQQDDRSAASIAADLY